LIVAASTETAEVLDLGSAVFLGTLQGLGEFLPISSSGHLALAQYFLGLKGEALTMFDVVLHLGTLTAVLWYYRRKFFLPPSDTDESFPNLRQSKSLLKLAIWLFLGLLPAVVAKLAFRETKSGSTPTWRSAIGDWREQASHRPRTVLFFLGCTSVVLVLASHARSQDMGISKMNWRHALVIGLAQACSAMCPGLSRSGMTISASLLLGLRPAWAVNFSLLLSIPTILAAFIWEARHLTPAWIQLNWFSAMMGISVSAFVGWVSIGLLARTVTRGHWIWFAAYLWVLIALINVILLGSAQPSG
jgi:undecaprenyl-diphosphatase